MDSYFLVADTGKGDAGGREIISPFLPIDRAETLANEKAKTLNREIEVYGLTFTEPTLRIAPPIERVRRKDVSPKPPEKKESRRSRKTAASKA